MKPIDPPYQQLIPACAAHGISRTVAFKLVKCGLLVTFKIGKARYVYLESLRTLPQRLAQEGGAE